MGRECFTDLIKHIAATVAIKQILNSVKIGLHLLT